LSTSTSLSTAQSAGAKNALRARPRRFRPFRLALLVLVIALLSLLHPDCFRFAVRQFIRVEAWRNGVDAQIGSVDGSLFEPLVVRDSLWTYESENGPVTRLGVKVATAHFSWSNLLPRSSGQWFQRLTLESVTAKVRMPLASDTALQRLPFSVDVPRPRGHWLAAPERLEAVDVDFIVESNGDYLRFLQAAFTLSNIEAGALTAGQVVVKQPWLTRTFRNVAGTTAIQDGMLQIAGLTLEPGVQVQDFSTRLDDFARGRLKFTVQVAAFGGRIRADVQTLPDEPQFSIDVAVPFSEIDVAKLATFLRVSDAAGGTIKTGKFTFRGPPQQFAKGSAELRFEAANFQWETRQWDSLVLGAKLLGGRIQVPELALTQGHNRLNLSGDMALPMPGIAWWRSEFSCDVTAKIDNLTELSALMLPEFQYAAGRATIDGSIRGRDRHFNGRINVTGSNLRWHNAPIEKLAASVKLNGNEYQITDISLFNGADYVNGSGVVNIMGDKQYWGEIRASVEDLGKYAAILQRPIIPEPLAGGARIDWSGEGSAKAHSGKFLARLRKVRSLGATAALLHPINADFEGSYSNGGMVFSTFALSDDDSSFTAEVGVVNKAVSLRGIRLVQKQALRLEGDALLPLDLWNSWPNTSFATLLDDQTVSRLNLTASDLSLHETAQLTGLKFPIAGLVRGNISAEGPLAALRTSGRLTLSKARLPLGWSGGALTGVEGALALDGQTLRLEKFTGQHSGGDLSATGEIDFTNLRDPTLKLGVTSAKSRLRLFPAADGTGLATELALALQLAGPLSAGKISGDAKILAITPLGSDAEPWPQLLFEDWPGDLPPVLTFASAPWKAWQIEIRVSADKVEIGSQALSADLRLAGTGATLALVGRASLQSSPRHNFQLLHQATLDFREGFPASPVITAEASGTVSGEAFSLSLTGTLQHPIRVFACHPPLTENAIRQAVNGVTAARYFSGENRFSLLVPTELREGIDLAAWPEIEAAPTPLPPAETPASAAPL